jgi:hypothetical protein
LETSREVETVYAECEVEDDVMKLFNKGIKSVLEAANVKENYDAQNQYGRVRVGPRDMTFKGGARPHLTSSTSSKHTQSEDETNKSGSESEKHVQARETKKMVKEENLMQTIAYNRQIKESGNGIFISD